jgi:hypothetical protein
MAERSTKETPAVVFWILVVAGLLINLGTCVPMTVLVVYHTYFQRTCMPTFDFIQGRSPNGPQNLQPLCCSCSRRVRVVA